MFSPMEVSEVSKEYYTVILKAKSLKAYITMRLSNGNLTFKTLTSVARWLGFSKGHMSQVMYALECPQKYPDIRVSGTFIATVMKKTGLMFDELFTIVPVDHDPMYNARKFQKR